MPYCSPVCILPYDTQWVMPKRSYHSIQYIVACLIAAMFVPCHIMTTIARHCVSLRSYHVAALKHCYIISTSLLLNPLRSSPIMLQSVVPAIQLTIEPSVNLEQDEEGSGEDSGHSELALGNWGQFRLRGREGNILPRLQSSPFLLKSKAAMRNIKPCKSIHEDYGTIRVLTIFTLWMENNMMMFLSEWTKLPKIPNNAPVNEA